MNDSQNKRIEILKSYLKKDPDDTFSNYALALEYMSNNDDRSVVEILEGILQRDDQYLAAYYQLGKAYEKISRTEDAKLIYQKGIRVGLKQKNQRTVNELKSASESLGNDE